MKTGIPKQHTVHRASQKIQTEKLVPSFEHPGRLVYDGQRTAQDVFNDLDGHLDSIGYLPDEYFLFDDRIWGSGREFPNEGRLTGQVDYGGSEGIYLDVALEYYENGKRKYEHFATGKTLGESGSDFDRMNLIASAIAKAFHEDGVHERYAVEREAFPSEGITVNFTPGERSLVADSLAQHCQNLAADDPVYHQAARLLNRVGGSAAGHGLPAEEEQHDAAEAQNWIQDAGPHLLSG